MRHIWKSAAQLEKNVVYCMALSYHSRHQAVGDREKGVASPHHLALHTQMSRSPSINPNRALSLISGYKIFDFPRFSVQ